MHEFDEFIEKHENPKHKKRFWEIVRWIDEKHPQLKREIKFNIEEKNHAGFWRKNN